MERLRASSVVLSEHLHSPIPAVLRILEHIHLQSRLSHHCGFERINSNGHSPSIHPLLWWNEPVHLYIWIGQFFRKVYCQRNHPIDQSGLAKFKTRLNAKLLRNELSVFGEDLVASAAVSIVKLDQNGLICDLKKSGDNCVVHYNSAPSLHHCRQIARIRIGQVLCHVAKPACFICNPIHDRAIPRQFQDLRLYWPHIKNMGLVCD